MGTRRFTILDAMLLVGATAFGLWLARMRILHDAAVSPRTAEQARQTWSAAAFLVLQGITLGMAVIRLRPPRPILRRLARQPGFLAGFAVSANFTLVTGLTGLHWLKLGGQPPWSGPDLMLWVREYLQSIGGPWNVGLAVMLAWAIGGLRGLEWARPDWIERAGRWLGVAWLLASVFVWVLVLRFFVWGP